MRRFGQLTLNEQTLVREFLAQKLWLTHEPPITNPNQLRFKTQQAAEKALYCETTIEVEQYEDYQRHLAKGTLVNLEALENPDPNVPETHAQALVRIFLTTY